MIHLSRVRLINWHNFVDDTLTFERITYLIGVNAVGKTTILDAIRYCLTTNKDFNALGNRKSARTLQGSVHGKQRGENAYTRRGHTVSYIGVEFYDQRQCKKFVVTVRVESESPEQEMRHVCQTWYISPMGICLEDLPFIDHSNNAPSSRDKFCISTGRMQPIDKQSEAKNMICQRLGIGKSDSPLGKKFSSVFPMGTSLDEIHDFRTFIYEYILPQPIMDLEALQKDEQELENLQETLTQAQRRAQQLQEIVALGDQAIEKDRDVCINRGFILYAQYQFDASAQTQLFADRERCIELLGRLQKQYDEAQQQAETAHAAYQQAWKAVQDSDEGKFLEVLRQKAKDTARELGDLQKKVSKCRNTQIEITELLIKASAIYSVDADMYPDAIRKQPQRNQMQILDSLENEITKLNAAVEKLYVELLVQSNDLQKTIEDLETKIRQLEKGQLVYPDKDRVNVVRNAINQAFVSQGLDPDAKVLCELLYMNDVSWQDCVEASMGYRRFDILVSPEHYPAAKQVFESLGENVGRVSLLDSPALHRDRNKAAVNGNVLASKVSSENLLARVYVGELLGNIVCCDNSSELENHPHSATRDLLRHYPYRLARLRKQERYIGLEARKKQLDEAKKQHRQMYQNDNGGASMGYIQGADRNQVILLPDTLDDYVGVDNEVRAIDAFIDSLDIASMGFKAAPAKEGRPGYDPRDMLKLYMYGYLNHIRSSRRLQREASRNVELMWLLRKIVPDFRCIADFWKDNAKAIREVFKAFVKLCNKAGLLSHESVVIDGSKFRTVNADNKSYVSSNAKKVLLDVEEKICQYMKELDEIDASESRPGALTKEDITGVLDYLERRKIQLTEALAQLENSGENQICTTDPESRLMKTRKGIRPSFNVQTAVESKNDLIVHYDVSSDCTDWNPLEAGINGSKAALGVENLEGIADKGYGNKDEILQCLLNGDTPTTHPSKGEHCRIFRFQKTDAEITGEMLASKDKDTLLRCVSAGVLPKVLQRDDLDLKIFRRREQGSKLYMDKETGELVSYEEMKVHGGLEKAHIEVKREPPLQPYFERDLEKDIVICPMGQTLFYAGPGHPNGKKDPTIRRYHRLSVCTKCPNKCTLGQRRIVSFREGETRKEEHFYEKARADKIIRKANHRFKWINLSEEERAWDEWVMLRFYPNLQHLRKRNTIVEHPYGTVKRWHGAGYLLTKGKLKVAAETGLSFLAYNFRRVVNLLGVNGILKEIKA